MDFDDNASESSDINELLGQLSAVADQRGLDSEQAKRDSTAFIVDCRQLLMKKYDGETTTEFGKIISSYCNFMEAKIISGAKDLVGLIFYNVINGTNSLSFPNIHVFHQLHCPSAASIKAARSLSGDTFQIQHSIHPESPVSLQNVMWLYSNQIKDISTSKFHLRLFLFTSSDDPHPHLDIRRQPSIAYGAQLAAKGVQIELFPIRNELTSEFDVRKFYQEIIVFDPEELHAGVINASLKISELSVRMRQRLHKKRVVARLDMHIGKKADVGVKIFALFNKAKKPTAVKVDAQTNKTLKKVTKLVSTATGNTLFQSQVGTCYVLGGEKIPFTRDEMKKIKDLQPPGMTLVGFKPADKLKPYYNLRPSYFLYPDQERVTGSSQFFSALLKKMVASQKIAIVKLVPRSSQQLRFGALLPQAESIDRDGNQTPPGMNLIVLPFADDLVSFTQPKKTSVQPTPVSRELLEVTRHFVTSLTLQDFSFSRFESPHLQKFYSHLESTALNQADVEEPQDLLQPDKQGMERIKDVAEAVMEVAKMEIEDEDCKGTKKDKKQNNKGKVEKATGEVVKKQEGIDQDEDEWKGDRKKRGQTKQIKSEALEPIRQVVPQDLRDLKKSKVTSQKPTAKQTKTKLRKGQSNQQAFQVGSNNNDDEGWEKWPEQQLAMPPKQKSIKREPSPEATKSSIRPLKDTTKSEQASLSKGADTEPAVTADNFTHMTINQLRKYLESLGLPTGGRKNELVQRVVQFLNGALV